MSNRSGDDEIWKAPLECRNIYKGLWRCHLSHSVPQANSSREKENIFSDYIEPVFHKMKNYKKKKKNSFPTPWGTV